MKVCVFQKNVWQTTNEEFQIPIPWTILRQRKPVSLRKVHFFQIQNIQLRLNMHKILCHWDSCILYGRFFSKLYYYESLYACDRINRQGIWDCWYILTSHAHWVECRPLHYGLQLPNLSSSINPMKEALYLTKLEMVLDEAFSELQSKWHNWNYIGGCSLPVWSSANVHWGDHICTMRFTCFTCCSIYWCIKICKDNHLVLPNKCHNLIPRHPSTTLWQTILIGQGPPANELLFTPVSHTHPTPSPSSHTSWPMGWLELAT